MSLDNVEIALAEFGAPPDFLVGLVQEAVMDRNVSGYLEMQGRALARTAVDQIPGARKPDSALKVPSAPNPWIKGVVNPLISPLVAGFKDEAKIRLAPLGRRLAVGVGLGLLAIALLSFAAGRATKPSTCRAP